MNPCFGAHKKKDYTPPINKVEAHVESTGDKKTALVIQNVKVSEVKQIMDFIAELRAKEKSL